MRAWLEALVTPRMYPDEFRARAVALVRSGQTVAKTAGDLGITVSRLYDLAKQDRIDRGEIKGLRGGEARELRKAKRRIRQLENYVEIVRLATDPFGSSLQHPKESTGDDH